MTLVTASIVTYRTEEAELKHAIEVLLRNGVCRIYISDNSPNDMLRIICSKYPEVEYWHNLRNIGYGSAHNIAIRRVLDLGIRYHLVVNSDVDFADDVIGKLVDYMDDNPDVAESQPNIIYPNGEPQHPGRLLPTPLTLLFRRFLPHKWAVRASHEYILECTDRSKEMNLPYLQGSFMLFRTECFKKVGLFDERFFMYPEDIDITRRMHRHYRTVYWPGATIVHAHRAASYKTFSMLKVHIYNMAKYFNKYGWFFDPERREMNRRVLREYRRH